jgi:DNA polymerase-3 subunit delta'
MWRSFSKGNEMGFADIIGHEKQIEMLKRAIGSGRLAHAYLFVGPDGIGKRLVALNLAKALHCEKSSSEPCDDCSSCRKIDRGHHIDVQVFAPKGLSRQLKVEQVEQFTGQVNLKPFEGNRKVFILIDADRANMSFQNKILKALEEPPDETLIILVTSNPDGLLPTIRSRCQVMNFSPLSVEAVEGFLVGSGVDADDARVAATLSQGQMSKALQWLDKERVAQRRRLFVLVSSKRRAAVEEIISVAKELESYLRAKRDTAIAEELDTARKDPSWANLDESVRSEVLDEIKADAEGRFRQEASEVLNYLASLYRDVLILKEAGREDLVMNSDMLDALKAAGDCCTHEEIVQNISAIEQTRESIGRNVKISNCIEALLLRLTDKGRAGVEI